MKRNPTVAGSFYPGYANVLRKEIEHYLSLADVGKINSEILGIIAPHAGYVYSGRCAAFSYKALTQKNIEVAIIIAPSHRFANFKYSVGSFESYLTPLGEIPVVQKLSNKLMKHEDFCFHRTAHLSEHSLEVQIPFLQITHPGIKILPILLGEQSAANSEKLAQILVEELKADLNKFAFIISTDLSHYYPSAVAEQMDNKLLNTFKQNDIFSMQNGFNEHKFEACGMGGIFVLMYLAKILNYNSFDVLNYTHSGDISGETSQVVGYLSGAVYK